MSDLVDPVQIEEIVGTRRHQVIHYGRAVSAEQRVFILHSAFCLASGIDLHDCVYSLALDRGIRMVDWRGWEDLAVPLSIGMTGRLIPRVDT